ncbi:cytochrome P450 6a2-like [Periplaneta americana]|uniref:cytochrome P450 6a2-like n=1 Tax=Periplaneta americana TaxID=6978 RepID=UPI0037E71971
METSSHLMVLSSLVFVVISALYFTFNMLVKYWKKRGVPYLEPTFPAGNLADMLTRRSSMGEAYANIYKRMAGMKFGGVYLMHRPILVVRDPEMIKSVLIKDFGHFHDHGFVFDEKIDPLVGNLFMLNGKKWKDLRTLLSPTFTSGKIKNMFNIFVECGLTLVKYLKDAADNEEMIETKDIFARFSTDVIASCAFGIECNCFKHSDAEFRRWGKRLISNSILQTVVGMLYISMPSVPIFFKMSMSSKSVSAFFRKIVKETVEFREKNAVRREDFMQLLIDLKEQKLQNGERSPGLTMDEITAQVMVFFTGGFETSSTTMSFCLYELAMNPDIQDRLRHEIDEILERYEGTVTYEAIKEMTYLDKVVSETLRKYPPITFLNRNCNKDYQIPGTDLVVERGIEVVIPVLGLHKDPEYYPDPEKFDPERFSEKAKAQRPNCVYLPFGEGPRICIGMRFGLLQTKVGLVSLLSSYDFGVCERTQTPVKIDPKMFITSALGGVWLRIRNRRNFSI